LTHCWTGLDQPNHPESAGHDALPCPAIARHQLSGAYRARLRMSEDRKKRQHETRHTHYSAAINISTTINRTNKRFANYCPEWLRRALEPIDIAPKNFAMIRQHRLYMTQQQCAAYLRVSVSTVSAWENGRTPIPFMAFETLRLMADTTEARLTHPEWEGWSVSRRGELCSPDNTVRLPEGAVRSYQFIVANVMPALRAEIRQLQTHLEQAKEAIRKASELTPAMDDTNRMKLAGAVMRALLETELTTGHTTQTGKALGTEPVQPTASGNGYDNREIDSLLGLPRTP